MRIVKEVFLISCLFCLSLAAGEARAVMLDPGGLETLSGTTASDQPDLAGVVLEDTLRPFVITWGGNHSITGTVQDRVVRSDVDNTLIFSYRILNDATSDGSIRFAGRTDFTGYLTDVNWRSDGLGTKAPGSASRSADGSDVSFFFNGPMSIDPGEDSYFFYIKTNATAYNEAGKGTIAATGGGNGGRFALFDTFQPLPVPVPNALLLFASGIAGLVAIKRRRNA